MIAIYRTLNEVSFEFNRKLYTSKIYISIDYPERDGSIIRPKGKYYFKNQIGTKTVMDENDNELQEPIYEELVLDTFNAEISIEDIYNIEQFILPDFSQSKFIFDAFEERVKQFTLLRIDQEQLEDPGTNWGITSSNLEVVLDN